MKLNSSKKIIIAFSVLIVVLLGLHYVVFSFIRKTDMTVSSLQSEVGLLQAQVLEFSKSSSDDVKKLAESVSDHFISRTNIVSFIENIEREARARRIEVAINSVGVEPLSDDPTLDKEKIRLRFVTQGSWSDTMNFINYIEHLPYKIDLQTLGMTVSSDNVPEGAPKSTKWQTQLEITTLKFK